MSAHHRRAGVSGRAWAAIRLAILERDAWRCQCCGKAGRMEVHHVKAVSDGGSNDLANLETLCVGCHLDHHRRALHPARAELLELVAELQN